MMRKVWPFVLAGVLCLGLCACGGGGESGGADENTPAGASPEAVEETTPTPSPTPEAEPEAQEVQVGGSIDNDNFVMSFTSVELLDEFSYDTSEYSSTSLYVEEGYKLLVVKGHMENKGTTTISDTAFAFTATVNDTYVVDGYDVRLNFIRDKNFEIDPYADLDYVLYINIPEKLAGMFETVTFTIGFNNDLSAPTTVWNSDGTSTVEVDNLYSLTSGLTA